MVTPLIQEHVRAVLDGMHRHFLVEAALPHNERRAAGRQGTSAGRFEENGFFLRPGEERAVNFVPLDPDGAPAEPLTAASVRVEHLAEHLLPPRETSGRRRDRLRARAAALWTTCLGAGGEGRDGL